MNTLIKNFARPLVLLLCLGGIQTPAQAQNFSGIDANSSNPNAATASPSSDATSQYATPTASSYMGTTATTTATTTGTPVSRMPSSVTGTAPVSTAAYEAATKTAVGAGGPQQFAFKVLAGDQGSKYTLGQTDVVEINVLRHPEVSGLYTLNSEGKIQYEFVGDVQFAGLTKEEAAAVLRKKLETYIVKPEVTVIIREYNSKVVYVVGEVGLPGKVFMRGDTITVRDALLAANLPQLTAATDNATLFTPSDSGKVVHKKVNVYALLYKGDLRENYVMNPGDTIYLPATLWAKVARFINPVTQPISQAAGTGGAIKGF